MSTSTGKSPRFGFVQSAGIGQKRTLNMVGFFKDVVGEYPYE